MITCTVLNEDKSIVQCDDFPKRFRPIMGWERDRRGNFHKILGDPRCITFHRAKAAIAEMERQKKEREQQPQQETRIIPFKDNSVPKKNFFKRVVPDYRTVQAKSILGLGKTFSEGKIMSAFDNFSVCLVNGDTQYAGPLRTRKCCLELLNSRQQYRKILIKSYVNLIYVWYENNNSEMPDLGIMGAIDDDRD